MSDDMTMHLPPGFAAPPVGPPPEEDGNSQVGSAHSAVPVEQMSLEELQKNFEGAVATYVALGGTDHADNPNLPMPALDDNGFNEWMQNGGLVEVIFAKIETAMADTQAQLANAKMVNNYALDIYGLSMDKAKSMEAEAGLIREKGQLEANQMYIQAAMSLVSAGVTIGLAGHSSKQYKGAQVEANKAAVGGADKAGPNANADADVGNLQISRRNSQAAPPAADPAAARRISDPANPAGAPDPAAPPLPANPPPPLRMSARELPADAHAGPGGKMKVETQTDVAIDPGKLQRLNYMDQTYKSLSESFIQAANGFVGGAYKVMISEKEAQIKEEHVNQTRMDAMITLLQSTMEVMKRFIDAASNRIDQNYNWSALFQSLAVGFQKL